jgi:hypothetical protein
MEKGKRIYGSGMRKQLTRNIGLLGRPLENFTEECEIKSEHYGNILGKIWIL